MWFAAANDSRMGQSNTKMKDDKPKVVFDTQSITQAALRPGGPGEKHGLLLMEEGLIEVYVSNRLRAEYEKTLRHPGLRDRYPHLTPEFVTAFLDRFDQRAIRIPNPSEVIGFKRDRNDEHVLNLMDVVKPDFVASRDPHLRVAANEPKYKEYFPNTRIVEGQTLRTEVERWQERKQAREQKVSMDQHIERGIRR